MTSPKQAANVLILGCGRSGTSIFGELFDHLSVYQYQSEPPYESLKALDYSLSHAIKVPRESVEIPPSPGLSFPLEDLPNVMPAPRQLFWQVRHPLDTICSLRVGISKNWGHHPRPADWQEWLDRSLLERCAHHWHYLNTVGYGQVKDQVEICRFEDMIADAFAFAERICVSVGLDPTTCKDEFQSWADRVQDTNNAKFVEAETSRAYSTKDHKVKVGRWKENLSQEEVDQISPIIRDTAQQFGYSW